MARKKQMTPAQVMDIYTEHWRLHYFNHLSNLAFQLFEWVNLPDSVNPRFLEQNLHIRGYMAFYKDPQLSYLATYGAISGRFDVYNEPTEFHAAMANYNKTFGLCNYIDMLDKSKGILIRNNDTITPTIEAVNIFAEELAQLKVITRINLNAQKTPFVFGADENTRLSILNAYNQIEKGAPAIVFDKDFDIKNIAVLRTDAPYIADKINVQRMNVWNEFLTFLGIQNANIEKRERLVSEEVNATEDQALNSSNIMLKSRKEACNLINKLYDLNLDVRLRADIVERLQNEMKEGEEDG